jgi:hypothetical protein
MNLKALGRRDEAAVLDGSDDDLTDELEDQLVELMDTLEEELGDLG